jgi:hypothetical protein
MHQGERGSPVRFRHWPSVPATLPDLDPEMMMRRPSAQQSNQQHNKGSIIVAYPPAGRGAARTMARVASPVAAAPFVSLVLLSALVLMLTQVSFL